MAYRTNLTQTAKEMKRKFGNIPNLQLRGTTYDAFHLDRFIHFDNERQQTMEAQRSGFRVLSSPELLN